MFYITIKSNKIWKHANMNSFPYVSLQYMRPVSTSKSKHYKIKTSMEYNDPIWLKHIPPKPASWCWLKRSNWPMCSSSSLHIFCIAVSLACFGGVSNPAKDAQHKATRRNRFEETYYDYLWYLNYFKLYQYWLYNYD